MSLEEIFLQAIEQKTQSEREAFLRIACGEDVQLREKADALIEAHHKGGSYLDRPLFRDRATEAPATIVATESEMIGPYKLLQQIGEGGFGVVFMAEQMRPVRRKVALKIIKPGMDTKEVVSRFEAERQALALMDHPNIAKVLDAGATESGRPFFVMELVKGVSITEYCDSNNLPTRKRLELFATVCRAVQHAHQKGVIHRDLKPSNVMVTLHDGQPVTKVIDFGVSKAISQQLTEKTMFTRYGQVLGTPQYMSPEQAEMSGLDIDTRSDIYSLGILLYELLVGQPPLDEEQLRMAGFDEMRRLIREQEPIRPSNVLMALDLDTATSVATHRASKPQALAKAIRGELDWVVMKALDKDRNRRYETAASLVEDLQRHLENAPVVARPPSQVYMLWKSVQRHRVLCLTASVVFFSLVTGLALALAGVRSATAAKRVAIQQGRSAVEASERAEDEAARTERTIRLLLDVLSRAKRNPQTGRDYTVAEALLEIGDALETEFVNELNGRKNIRPGTTSQLHYTIGRSYFNNRDFGMAAQHLQKAAELSAKTVRPADHGDRDSTQADIYSLLGASYFYLHDLDNAESHLLRAISVFEPSDRVESPEAIPHLFLSWISREKGNHAASEKYRNEAIQLADHMFRPAGPAWDGLGDRLAKGGFLKPAEDAYLAALAANANADDAGGDLGIVYRSQGRHDDARKLYEELLQKSLARDDNWNVFWHRVRLSRVYQDVRDLSTAKSLLGEALSCSPPQPFAFCCGWLELAMLLEEHGEVDEAREHRAHLAETLSQSIVNGDQVWSTTVDRIVELECRLRICDEFELNDYLQQIEQIWNEVDNDWEFGLVARIYGLAYEQAMDDSQAIDWYEKAVTKREFFNEMARGYWVEERLVHLYIRKDDLQRGATFFEQVLKQRQRKLDPRHPILAFTRVRLARLLAAQEKDLERAAELLNGAFELLDGSTLTPAKQKQEISSLLEGIHARTDRQTEVRLGKPMSSRPK